MSQEDWTEAVEQQMHDEMLQETHASIGNAMRVMAEAQKKQDEEVDWFQIFPLFLGVMVGLGAALGVFAIGLRILWRWWPLL